MMIIVEIAEMRERGIKSTVRLPGGPAAPAVRERFYGCRLFVPIVM